MFIVLLLTAIVNVALACFVFEEHPEWTNRLFAVVATSVAGWTLAFVSQHKSHPAYLCSSLRALPLPWPRLPCIRFCFFLRA